MKTLQQERQTTTIREAKERIARAKQSGVNEPLISEEWVASLIGGLLILLATIWVSNLPSKTHPTSEEYQEARQILQYLQEK